jgi:hypothetical protein
MIEVTMKNVNSAIASEGFTSESRQDLAVGPRWDFVPRHPDLTPRVSISFHPAPNKNISREAFTKSKIAAAVILKIKNRLQLPDGLNYMSS